ncbi:MAG: GNAT family N-acetyltransferase [candidate division Zixibacteria bacterium]|nr:GNAT family N-acetyltransferase [candidate division Zixibacteria bacterium]
MNCTVRTLKDDDGKAVVNIFNYFVENSFAAYPQRKVGLEFFYRLRELAGNYPFYAAVDKGKGVIGFGLIRPFLNLDTFKRTAEITYFILPDFTDKGLGKRFPDRLTADARNIGVKVLIANISSLNQQSISFHEKYGF